MKIQQWDIGRVKPYDKNAKVHNPDQVKKIAKSVTEFGWDQPIVVDKDGVIIKGHGRRLAALELGLKSVPVLMRDDLTEDQVRAARLADNRVAIGDIDTDLLQIELASMNFDLAGIFDSKELDFMVSDLATVNMDAFIDNIEVEAEKQTKQTAEKVKEVDSKEIPIAKALGFKTITVKDEKYVASFVATIEASTGLSGANAFVEFAKEFLQSASGQ